MCRLWPAISPHGPDVPTSVWNLSFGTWVGFAQACDQYIDERSKGASG